jgi:pyruvate formate lyase activating enzyme
MRLAKTKGLYNTYVTNLYSTPEALQMIIESGCDAFCVNVKGDADVVRKYCGGEVEKVWRNLRILKKYLKHIEIVTLVIPTVNDGETTLRSIASRIREELGADVPWHCTGYFAAYRSSEFDLPDQTPVSSLEKARKIGFDEGLKYVYLGNVPGNEGENTYCPVCKSLLIERFGFSIKYHHINRSNNSCANCSYKINVVGKCQ